MLSESLDFHGGIPHSVLLKCNKALVNMQDAQSLLVLSCMYNLSSKSENVKILA
jgi:hypothetical protein